VAVGYESTGDYLCEHPDVDGIVWTSSDGDDWVESRPRALAGLSLRRLVNAGGTLYAFGSVGHSDCADDYVIAIARSLDGSSWDRLQPELPENFWISGVGAGEGMLIVLDEESTWTSPDGTHWQRSAEVPYSYSWFEDIAVLREAAVVFEGFAEEPVWFSDDSGESWRHADLRPSYGLFFNDATASGDRVVAVGSACCALPNESAGVTMTSTDGQHWQESVAFRDVPQAVVGLPVGYLAIGDATWFSPDGIAWRLGPRLSNVDTNEEVTAVSADAGVLVVNAGNAWFAPSDALALDRWTETSPVAEMPEMGVRYPVELFTHCGFPDVHFGLRTWVPDPPFEDNINPPPGFREEDHGWLTQLGDDELRYENRGGHTVNLVPSDPVNYGPCA
jgi:hypothetical protein